MILVIPHAINMVCVKWFQSETADTRTIIGRNKLQQWQLEAGCLVEKKTCSMFQTILDEVRRHKDLSFIEMLRIF